VHDLLGLLRTTGAPAARVSVERPSLDDVFLSLTESSAESSSESSTESSRATSSRATEKASTR